MENINTSFPDDGLGDKVRNAFIKVNDNFTELNLNKVDKVTGKGLSDENYSTSEKGLVATIVNKVDKVTGKGLSTNDYDNTEKAKVAFALQTSQIGQPLGVAGLDDNGQVPSVNLPSYVDDVIEVADLTALNALPPSEKMSGKIYITLDTNKSYRWSGSVFVYITSGAVDSVAGKTGVITLVKADVGLPLADNTEDATKNVLSATKLTTARTINGVAFNGTSNITIVDATKEPSFSKNTAFNKNFGTVANTVAEGNHQHTFAQLTAKPTTLVGYGITNAVPYTGATSDLNMGTFKGSFGGLNVLSSSSNTPGTITLSSYSGPVLVGNSAGQIDFYTNDDSAITNRVVTSIKSIAEVNYAGNSAPTSLAFFTQKFNPTGEAATEKMRVMSNGNVGIGTTTPTEKLQVTGNVEATTFIKTGGLSTQFLKANGSIDLTNYEPAFTKLNAFNKNFGTTTGTVAEGNHTHKPTIKITTAVDITSATLDSDGLGQDGRNVILNNSADVSYTINNALTTTFMKLGTFGVTFVQGTGRTLVAMDGTVIFNGASGSRASIISDGTTDYLYITNY